MPIIIHLLNRRRVRKIKFSSLEFLTELARRRMRKINLRRIIILALRTLAIILVVMAFARPTLRSASFLLPGKAARNVVICLDASYSMSVDNEEGTVFTAAKRIASTIVDEAGKHDTINLVVFSDRADITLENGTRNKSVVKNVIAKAQVTTETTSITRAIDTAYDVIDQSDVSGGEIYVVSDFRYTTDSTLAGRHPDRRDVRVFLVPVVEEDVDNVSIDRVMVPRKLLRPGEVIRVDVAVTNHSREKPVDFPLELVVEANRKAEKVIKLAPGSSTTVTFPVSFTDWGTYRCKVAKSHDRLPVDDDRYFLLEVSKSVPVTLVRGRRRLGDEPRRDVTGIGGAAGFFYLGKALNPRPAGGGEFTVETIDEKDITAAALPDRGVVVWVNPQTMQSKRLTLLERYVARGGGLMVFLGNGDRRLLQNERFLKFVGMRSATERGGQSTAAHTSYTSFRKEHPVFRMFSEEELQLLSRTRARSYVAARGVSPDSVLAYVSGGDPAVWECARGKGRILVFAAAPDLESGDIPLSPMFLPLVHTSVSYLASAGIAQRRQENTAGQQLFFDAPQSTLAASQLLVRAPGGTPLRPLLFETPAGERRVICERPREVGFYKLMTDTTVVTEVAVNLDTRESNTAALGIPEKDFDAADVVSTDGDFLDNLQTSRQGREIFGLFIFLAVMALTAESILGRKA